MITEIKHTIFINAKGEKHGEWNVINKAGNAKQYFGMSADRLTQSEKTFLQTHYADCSEIRTAFGEVVKQYVYRKGNVL